MGLLGDVFKIGGSIIGGNSSKKASKKAQAAQIAGLNNAMGSVNSGYRDITGIVSPYTSAGASASSNLAALLGVGGTTDWNAYAMANPDIVAEYQANVDKSQFPTLQDYAEYHYQNFGQREGRDITAFTPDQAGAIDSLKNSPLYQSLYENGEEAILQNGAATGGLRGGNIQGALAGFGRDTLSSVIQNQISNLSNLAGSGLQAAGIQANAANSRAGSLAQLMTQIGDTNAGGILQRGAINANTINQVSSGLGSMAEGLVGAFGGGGIKF